MSALGSPTGVDGPVDNRSDRCWSLALNCDSDGSPLPPRDGIGTGPTSGLDRCFVTHMSSDPRAATIVRSTVELSHQLGMLMVAEGVEDAAALQMLREAGCDVAQGYHIARPMPAEQITQWLDAPTSPCTRPLNTPDSGATETVAAL